MTRTLRKEAIRPEACRVHGVSVATYCQGLVVLSDDSAAGGPDLAALVVTLPVQVSARTYGFRLMAQRGPRARRGIPRMWSNSRNSSTGFYLYHATQAMTSISSSGGLGHSADGLQSAGAGSHTPALNARASEWGVMAERPCEGLESRGP